jgi:hypothetical protein
VKEHITFVGLDVHQATIAVCVAEAGREGEVRFVGEIPNTPAAIDKLVARLGRGGQSLRLAYEAGPCVSNDIGSAPLGATKTPPDLTFPDPVIGSGAATFSRPDRRFTLSRKLSPRMVTTWLHLVARIEPPRLRRRLGSLSQAAMAAGLS